MKIHFNIHLIFHYRLKEKLVELSILPFSPFLSKITSILFFSFPVKRPFPNNNCKCFIVFSPKFIQKFIHCSFYCCFSQLLPIVVALDNGIIVIFFGQSQIQIPLAPPSLSVVAAVVVAWETPKSCIIINNNKIQKTKSLKETFCPQMSSPFTMIYA